MKTQLPQKLALATAAAVAISSAQAATNLLTNGDFEAGSLAGWTVTDLAGGVGTFYVDTPGTTTPESGQATSSTAANGNFYAVTDQDGPGTHSLVQSFTVPASASSVILAFDMFVNSYGGTAINAAGLDHTAAGANQHARVDLLSSGAGAFDTGAGVVSNFYLGVDAGTNPNPFTSYSFDITASVAAGGTYQIRFAESDNQLFLNQGVDNVSIMATTSSVPDAGSTVLMLGLSLGSVFGFAGLRKKSTR